MQGHKNKFGSCFTSKGKVNFRRVHISNVKANTEGFPGGAVVKNPPANAGHTGLSPGPGRSHMLRSN